MFLTSTCLPSFLQNRGPPREEATALTNSNVRHHRPPLIHTQGRSLCTHSPRRPSRWSSPCPLRQLCRSMQRIPPPSLNMCYAMLHYFDNQGVETPQSKFLWAGRRPEATWGVLRNLLTLTALLGFVGWYLFTLSCTCLFFAWNCWRLELLWR